MSEQEYIVVKKTYPANNSLAVIEKKTVSKVEYAAEEYKPYRERWKINPLGGDLIHYGSCVNNDDATKMLLSTL